MEGSTRLAGCTGECVPIIVCSDGRKVFMAEGVPEPGGEDGERMRAEGGDI